MEVTSLLDQTYTSPADETTEAASSGNGIGASWRISTRISKKLLGGLVSDEVDPSSDGIPNCGEVSARIVLVIVVTTYACVSGTRNKDLESPYA